MKDRRNIEIDFNHLVKAFIKKWWVIFICFIIFVSLSIYYSYYVLEEIFQAETTLFIGKEKGGIDSINLGTISLNNQLIDDYIEIIRSRSVAEEVIQKLNLDISIVQFQNSIKVAQVNNSRIFKVSFISKDPILAAEITNNISQVIIIKANEIIGVQNIQIIDKAIVPNIPIEPNKRMNVITGCGLGIILGILLIFFLELLDSTFKRVEEVEKILEISILGVIPEFKGEKRK